METQRIRRFGWRNRNGYLFADLSDVVFCQAEGNYTRIVLHSGAPVLIARKIKWVEQALPADSFFRAHHSYLVNLHHVAAIELEAEAQLLMTNQQMVPLARLRRKDFYTCFYLL